MNGILCINKPQEYTSFDVVARIRGMSKTKRVGHSGTLDPLATGVLPVFIGNATKACDMLPTDDKHYVATFKLGVSTDTLDVSGTVLSTKESNVKTEDILSLLPQFRGEIEQIPPMYSAIRVNGQRLYDIARQGIVIDRASRKVTIFKLELLSFDEEKQEGTLFVFCSKGTYIRTIISDIGDKLNVGGIMTELVRTVASVFKLEDCITLEQAQELTLTGKLEEYLMPVDKIFHHLPKIMLNEIQSQKYRNGVKLDLKRVIYQDVDSLHRVYDYNKVFMGLARLNLDKMELIIEKMFV
ncbi:MAG: tRNA pseudouridine(55) synthase TruB [Oscillospiraceae bacterium]